MTDKLYPRATASIHSLQKVDPGQAHAARAALQAKLDHAARSDGLVLAVALQLPMADGVFLASHIAFDSAAQRDAWQGDLPPQSSVQGQTLHEATADGPVVWIEVPGLARAMTRPVPPPKWKMAILSWLTIFPTLTLFLMLTSPYLQSLHLVGRIFINTILIAPLMTWVLMPTMTRIFRPWLLADL